MDNKEKYVNSTEFSDGVFELIIKDTWYKGKPMCYANKNGQIVKHWANGQIEIIKFADSDTKYYFYSNKNRGERFFKVVNGEDYVLQIIDKTVPKAGRPYQRGVNYIKYISFISNWGWQLKESKNIKEITEAEFNLALDKMITNFKK